MKKNRKLSEQEKELRAIKRKEEKEQREFDIMLKHDGLIKVLFKLFEGQILNIDLNEFCINYKMYKDESQYDEAISSLVRDGVIKKRKLVNTTHVVIVARAPVFRYFNINDTMEYKTLTVRRSSYKSYMIMDAIKHNVEDINVDSLISRVQKLTTFLTKKYEPKATYDFINNNFKLSFEGQEIYNIVKYKDYLIKQRLNENRKSGPIYIDVVEKPDVLDYKYTDEIKSFQSLRNQDIYTMFSPKKERITFFISDAEQDITLDNLIKKIQLIINVYSNQLDECEYKNLNQVRIKILLRSNLEESKLANQFSAYEYIDQSRAGKERRKQANSKQNKVREEKHKINKLLTNLNKKLNVDGNTSEFEYKENKQEGNSFVFQNERVFYKNTGIAEKDIEQTYSFKYLIVNPININRDDRLTMRMNKQQLVESNIDKKKESLIKPYLKEIEELKARIKELEETDNI